MKNIIFLILVIGVLLGCNSGNQQPCEKNKFEAVSAVLELVFTDLEGIVRIVGNADYGSALYTKTKQVKAIVASTKHEADIGNLNLEKITLMSTSVNELVEHIKMIEVMNPLIPDDLIAACVRANYRSNTALKLMEQVSNEFSTQE